MSFNTEVGLIVVLAPLLLAFAALMLIEALDGRSTPAERPREPFTSNLHRLEAHLDGVERRLLRKRWP